MENKLNPTLKAKVLQTRVTKMEASLLKQLRSLDYGEFNIVVHKIEGQPVRITVKSSTKSIVLDANDGLNLEDTIYVR